MVSFLCFHASPISARHHGSKASSQLKPAMWPWITVLWKPCLRTADCFLLNSREVWGSLCWDQSWYGKAVIFLEPVEGMFRIQQLHASRIHSGFWFWFLVLFYLFVFPITAVFSGRKYGSSPRSLLTFLPPPAWPKISCDSRSLISSRYPPAALTPFGHVARFQAPGIKSWVSSKAIVVTRLSTSKCELN